MDRLKFGKKWRQNLVYKIIHIFPRNNLLIIYVTLGKETEDRRNPSSLCVYDNHLQNRQEYAFKVLCYLQSEKIWVAVLQN